MKLRNKIYATFALMVVAGTFCFSSISHMLINLPPIFGLDAYSIIIGIGYFFLASLIIEYFILFRIEQLKKCMEALDLSGHVNKDKIYCYSKDELGEIVRNINSTLEELNKQRGRAETKNKLYLSLVNDKSIYAYRFKPSGEITFINKTFASQFNKGHKDLLGSSLYEYFETSGFDAEEINRTVALLNPTNPSSNMIFDMPRVLSKGIPKWIAWTVSAAFNEKGIPMEYQVVGIDMHRYPAVINDEKENRHKSTILLNTNGKIDYMFNLIECDEGIGEDLLNYIHESDQWVMEKAINKILAHRDESLINVRIKINNKFIYTQMAVGCSVDKEDNIKNVVIHAIDMTEIQGAQEKVVGAVNDMHKILEQKF